MVAQLAPLMQIRSQAGTSEDPKDAKLANEVHHSLLSGVQGPWTIYCPELRDSQGEAGCLLPGEHLLICITGRGRSKEHSVRADELEINHRSSMWLIGNLFVRAIGNFARRRLSK